jgi:hypothetical protein
LKELTSGGDSGSAGAVGEVFTTIEDVLGTNSTLKVIKGGEYFYLQTTIDGDDITVEVLFGGVLDPGDYEVTILESNPFSIPDNRLTAFTFTIT